MKCPVEIAEEISVWRVKEKKITGRQQKKWRRNGLWKRRGVEKSNNRLSHSAWKSRKPAGFPLSHSPDGYGRLTKIEHSLFYEKGTLLMS
jgi:hypothetical protein